MSNSRLISGSLITNNCTAPRNHIIDRITPHYMDGLLTAKQCCELFVPSSRRASANYCIGKDGEIWLNVEEKNRAWTSGSSYNDNRAVTIECASYVSGSRYGELPSETWNSLVNLCVDICKRNDIQRINYTGDDSGNLTMHKWYQDTDCPGPWLSRQFDRLAKEINLKLGWPEISINAPSVIGGLYRCRVNGLHVRTSPSLNGRIVATYNMGANIYLDDWYTIEGGYVWGRYTGQQSGEHRYIAIGRNTGKPESDDFLIKV